MKLVPQNAKPVDFGEFLSILRNFPLVEKRYNPTREQKVYVSHYYFMVDGEELYVPDGIYRRALEDGLIKVSNRVVRTGEIYENGAYYPTATFQVFEHTAAPDLPDNRMRFQF